MAVKADGRRGILAVGRPFQSIGTALGRRPGRTSLGLRDVRPNSPQMSLFVAVCRSLTLPVTPCLSSPLKGDNFGVDQPSGLLLYRPIRPVKEHSHVGAPTVSHDPNECGDRCRVARNTGSGGFGWMILDGRSGRGRAVLLRDLNAGHGGSSVFGLDCISAASGGCPARPPDRPRSAGALAASRRA